MKKILFVLAFFMLLSSSCKGPFGYNDEDVLESEVLDKGFGETVEEAVLIDTDGDTVTKVSYKSWILVKGQTRGDFEERVEVELENVFKNTDVVLEVENLGITEYQTSMSYKAKESRKEGFVTIVDSVLIYTVSCGNFFFDYELDYQVASYDDGVTRSVMPYYKIGAVVDKGIQSYSEDFVVEENNDVYIRAFLTHAISVEFQNKTYELTAKVELRKYAGQHPCIVKSLNTGATVYFTGNEVVSTLKLERTWSDGTVKEDEVTCRMQVYWQHNLEYENSVVIDSLPHDLMIVSSGLIENEDGCEVYDENFVVIRRYVHQYYVNYNCPITTKFDLAKDRAWYDDGFVKREFPNLGLDSITFTNSEPVVRFLNDGVNENGNYSVYCLDQTVEGKIDLQSFETSMSKEFVIYK